MFTHYGDIKGRTKHTNWGGLRVRGHPNHPKSPFDRASTYDFNKNYASIMYRFQVIASYLLKFANFSLPHWHLASLLGWPWSNFAKISDIRKLKFLGYCVVLFAWSKI